MQLPPDRTNRLDDIKTQFRAREGHYRLMNSPDYFQRPQRNFGNGSMNQNTNFHSDQERCEKTWIKISLVTVNDNNDPIVGIKQRSHPCDQVNTSNNSSSTNRPIITRKGTRTIRDRKICFNIGLELFIYNYDGIKNGPDSNGPLFKKTFKGNTPICHDFNQATCTTSSIRLLVGLSQGQIQLIEFNSEGCEKEENFKEFNSDRLIDKTRVTCIRWLPNSPSLFLVGHASGQLYLYKDDLICGPSAPVYHLFKQSEGVIVYTCKTKATRGSTRNPIYKWTIGGQSLDGVGSSHSLVSSSTSLHNIENECYSLNDFVFSPCSKYLACVSQDGFLRVFCYDTMEMVGRAKSYYGGLTCVCWSPDGKYVVTGGEDDLVTIWSFVERRVVARGMGHKSWVSVVSFDNYYTGRFSKESDVDNDDDEDDDKELNDSYPEEDEHEDDEIIPYDREKFSKQKSLDFRTISMTDETSNSPTKNQINNLNSDNSSHEPLACSAQSNRLSLNDRNSANSTSIMSYRFGSVGHDTQLCLWDLSDDLLKQPLTKSKISSSGLFLTSNNVNGQDNSDNLKFNHNSLKETDLNGLNTSNNQGSSSQKDPKFSDSPSTSSGFLTLRSSGFAKSFSLMGKRDKRSMSQRSGSNKHNLTFSNSNKLTQEPKKLLGSPMCPRMNEVPVIQPLVCKKISYERLTSLIFLRGGFITSCQEGYIYSWARP